MADISGGPGKTRTLAKLAVVLVAIGVLAAGLALPYVGGLGLLAGHESQKFNDTTCDLTQTLPPQATTMYANDGKTVIARIFTQNRQPVQLSQIPQSTQDALIATEDRRFYQHHGVDLRGLVRSAVSTSGGDTQGGSTLTMQYVKQERYFQAGDNKAKQDAAIATTLKRKMQDARCALYFENVRHESKHEILDDYFNIAFFGENSYGIQTAAETYFNKPAAKLTLSESAVLVGLLRAPTDFDPFLHRQASTARRNQVLQNLVDVGKLTETAARKLAAQPIALATEQPRPENEGCANASSVNPDIKNAAFFCEYAQQWLTTQGKISSTTLNTGGLKIVTTLDPKIQNATQANIAKTVPATAATTAVLPVTDPSNGYVMAMAASKTFGSGKGQTEQPIFTTPIADAASTYKLFPLLAALSIGVPKDQNIYAPAPYKVNNCPSTKKGVVNDNTIADYGPNETMRSATAKSSNTYFVGLADQLFGCDLQPMITLAQKLGLTPLDQPPADGGRYKTLAQEIQNLQQAQLFTLGNLPTSPLQLTGAYAAIANGGQFVAPTPIKSVTDAHGRPLTIQQTLPERVVAPQVAANAVQLLEGDTQTGAQGTSSAAFQKWYANGGSDIAGKTGTKDAGTKNNGAIWFVGMTPKLVATNAMINIDKSSAPNAGLPGVKKGQAYGAYAAKVWVKALQSTIKSQKWTWPDPSNIGQPVPSIIGQTISQATKTLSGNGSFKLQVLDQGENLECSGAASVPAGSVAFYGPKRATPGSTITVCPSKQLALNAPPPPPKPLPANPRRSGASGSGANRSGANRSGGAGRPSGHNTPHPGNSAGGHSRPAGGHSSGR